MPVRAEVGQGIGKLIIDFPPVNVLDLKGMEDLHRELEKLLADDLVRIVTVEGAGEKAFCAGVDVRDHGPGTAAKMVDKFGELTRALLGSPKPTVALVRGLALGGGCELAAVCDFVVASERARFGQPEITVGVFPGPAVVWLPRILGLKRAMELILIGEPVAAQRAYEMGLVSLVVEEEKWDKGVEAFLEKLLDKSGAVLRLARRAVYENLDKDCFSALQHVDELYLTELVNTEDFHEGLQAFLEKRPPRWRHR